MVAVTDGGKSPHHTSIEELPEVVEQRQRLSDWEANTIGRRGAIVTLVERKSRLTLLEKIDADPSTDRPLGEVRLVVDGSRVGFHHQLLGGLAFRRRVLPLV